MRSHYRYSYSVFHLPFALQRQQTLVDVGRNVWMDMEMELLNANFVDQLVNLALKLVGEKYARLYLDGTMQMWIDAEDSLELW